VRQSAKLELPAPRFAEGAPGGGYFAALRERFETRYGEVDADMTRAQHQLRVAFRARAPSDETGATRDRACLAELQRLHGCDPALYDRPDLAQEQIAENLKRIRSSLVVRGFANSLHNVVPVAVAPRVAHVRVPEPLAVHEAFAPGAGEAAAKARLLAELRVRMQSALDGLRAEIAPVVDRRRRANPLFTGG